MCEVSVITELKRDTLDKATKIYSELMLKGEP